MRICKPVIAALATLFLLSACSVNVKKNEQGQDKNVDIRTPFGEINVDKGADVKDTGLPVYAGARLKRDTDQDKKSANVNISSFGFGLKVVALEYESDDAPSKIIAFYKDQLKKYGTVLECHTHGSNYSYDKDGKSEELRCEGDNNGKTVELKAGKRDDQHIVSVDSEGKGSKFALVYVRVRGKEDTI
jgi:hypothetical protein